MPDKNVVYRQIEECTSKFDCTELLSNLAGENVNEWKSRIESRILQLVPPKQSNKSKTGAINSASASKSTNMKYIKMGAKQLSKLGLLKTPKYMAVDHSIALHNLWLQYISDTLKDCKSDSDILNRLFFADLHGALLTVNQSSCPNYVNLSGIVIYDSSMSFRLAGRDCKVRTVLKALCVFALEINGSKYYLHGRHLQGPQLARSKLKPKPKSTIEL